jgi:hypothetical protein
MHPLVTNLIGMEIKFGEFLIDDKEEMRRE